MSIAEIDQMKHRRFRRIQYLDLSADLDHGLAFIAELAQRAAPDGVGDELIPEFGYCVVDYLGKRIALEHVYFGRSLRGAKIEESKLKSEVWRVQKIKAKAGLWAKTETENR